MSQAESTKLTEPTQSIEYSSNGHLSFPVPRSGYPMRSISGDGVHYVVASNSALASTSHIPDQMSTSPQVIRHVSAVSLKSRKQQPDNNQSQSNIHIPVHPNPFPTAPEWVFWPVAFTKLLRVVLAGIIFLLLSKSSSYCVHYTNGSFDCMSAVFDTMGYYKHYRCHKESHESSKHCFPQKIAFAQLYILVLSIAELVLSGFILCLFDRFLRYWPYFFMTLTVLSCSGWLSGTAIELWVVTSWWEDFRLILGMSPIPWQRDLLFPKQKGLLVSDIKVPQAWVAAASLAAVMLLISVIEAFSLAFIHFRAQQNRTGAPTMGRDHDHLPRHPRSRSPSPSAQPVTYKVENDFILVPTCSYAHHVPLPAPKVPTVPKNASMKTSPNPSFRCNPIFSPNNHIYNENYTEAELSDSSEIEFRNFDHAAPDQFQLSEPHHRADHRADHRGEDMFNETESGLIVPNIVSKFGSDAYKNDRSSKRKRNKRNSKFKSNKRNVNLKGKKSKRGKGKDTNGSFKKISLKLFGKKMESSASSDVTPDLCSFPKNC